MIPLKPVSALVFACSCAFVPVIAAEPMSAGWGGSAQGLPKLLQESYSSSDVRMAAWARVREMDAAAIEPLLGELKKDGVYQLDSSMLFYRLAQLDPERALKLLGDSRDDAYFRLIVVSVWMRKDPEAAYAHLENEPLSEMAGKTMLARMLAGQGLKPALEKSKAIGGEVRRQTLENLAAKVRMGSIGSQAFLAALDLQDDEGSGKERAACEASLMQSSAQRDPAALLEAVRGDREKTGATLGEWRRNDPAGALMWAVDHPEIWGLEALVRSYFDWVLQAPEIAPGILPALEKRPGFLEGMVNKFLPIYVQAVQSASIPIQKNFCPSMRDFFRRWSELDPAAASAWRESQPAYLRNDPTFTLSREYIVPAPPLPTAPSAKPAVTVDPDLLESLRKLWWDSPEPLGDFEWQWQTAQALDKCPADELACLFWSSDHLVIGSLALHSQVAAAWARKDPGAAIEASLARRDTISTPDLFMNWLQRDSATALSWRGSRGELSQELKHLRSGALGSLFSVDPQLAFSNLAYLDHEEVVAFFNSHLDVMTYDPAKDDATQQLVIRAAGNCLSPGEMAELKANFAAHLVRKDPAAARKLASSLVLPVDRAIELDAQITFDAYDPTGATLRDWVARNAGVVPLPKQVENQLDYEAGRVPPESNEWLQSLPAGLQRDAIYSYIVSKNSSRAMKLLDRIESPLFRAITLRNLDRIELRSQPDIEKWRQSLSESDRAFLDR